MRSTWPSRATRVALLVVAVLGTACSREPRARPPAGSPGNWAAGASQPGSGPWSSPPPTEPQLGAPPPGASSVRDLSGQGGGISMTLERFDRVVVDFAGVVTAIHPPTGTAGREAWTGIQLGAQRFDMLVDPPGLGLPFAVGEPITAQVDCRGGGSHRLCHGWVRDARGALVVASADTGKTPLEGFSASPAPGGAPDERGVVITGLVIERGGSSVTTAPSIWQRLAAPDGTWLVTGRSQRYTGSRRSGAVDHQLYSAVRLSAGR